MAYNWERLLIMYQLFFLFNNILCRHQYFLLSVTLLHILYKKCCKKSFHKYFCRITLQIIVKHKEEEEKKTTTPSFDYFSAIGPSSRRKEKKLWYCFNTSKELLSLKTMAIKYIHKTVDLCQGNNSWFFADCFKIFNIY